MRKKMLKRNVEMLFQVKNNKKSHLFLLKENAPKNRRRREAVRVQIYPLSQIL